MFDQTIGSRELNYKSAEIMGRITVKKGQANSFKQMRKARKKGRSKNRRGNPGQTQAGSIKGI